MINPADGKLQQNPNQCGIPHVFEESAYDGEVLCARCKHVQGGDCHRDPFHRPVPAGEGPVTSREVQRDEVEFTTTNEEMEFVEVRSIDSELVKMAILRKDESQGEHEIDVDRLVVRLRRVLKGPKAFAFNADYEYHRGVLLKTLRSVRWNLGEEGMYGDEESAKTAVLGEAVEPVDHRISTQYLKADERSSRQLLREQSTCSFRHSYVPPLYAEEILCRSCNHQRWAGCHADIPRGIPMDESPVGAAESAREAAGSNPVGAASDGLGFEVAVDCVCERAREQCDDECPVVSAFLQRSLCCKEIVMHGVHSHGPGDVPIGSDHDADASVGERVAFLRERGLDDEGCQQCGGIGWVPAQRYSFVGGGLGWGICFKCNSWGLGHRQAPADGPDSAQEAAYKLRVATITAEPFWRDKYGRIYQTVEHLGDTHLRNVELYLKDRITKARSGHGARHSEKLVAVQEEIIRRRQVMGRARRSIWSLADDPDEELAQELREDAHLGAHDMDDEFCAGAPVQPLTTPGEAMSAFWKESSAAWTAFRRSQTASYEEWKVAERVAWSRLQQAIGPLGSRPK